MIRTTSGISKYNILHFIGIFFPTFKLDEPLFKEISLINSCRRCFLLFTSIGLG